eukprot:403345983
MSSQQSSASNQSALYTSQQGVSLQRNSSLETPQGNVEQQSKSISHQTNDHQKQQEYSLCIRFLVCVFFGCSSSMLQIVNKSLQQNFQFKSHMNIMLSQCVCNIFICTLMMFYKQYNPKAFMIFEKFGMRIPPFNETITKYNMGLRMGFANLISVNFGLLGSKIVNIPMFLTLRRCSILTVVLMNYFIMGSVPDSYLMLTLVLSLSGSVVAGYETLNTDWFGYFIVWMNNLAQSIYNVYVSKVNKEKKVLPFEINFYFACCGLPVALFYTIYMGEVGEFQTIFSLQQDFYSQLGFIAHFTVSGVFGIVITISMLMLITINGPIAPYFVGAVKDIFLTIFSFVYFNDASFTHMVGLGLLLSFCGVAVYTYDQYNKSLLQKQEKLKSQ